MNDYLYKQPRGWRGGEPTETKGPPRVMRYLEHPENDGFFVGSTWKDKLTAAPVAEKETGSAKELHGGFMNKSNTNLQKQLLKPVLPRRANHRVYLHNAGLAIANVILDNRISRQTVKRDLEDLREAIDLAIRIVGNGSDKSPAALH